MQNIFNPPLILTLRPDEERQAFFDRQRERYFPPSRNYLKAHIMLFHQLPDIPSTQQYLESIQMDCFDILVTGLMNLGGGVAYALHNPDLKPLYQQLAMNFDEVLIPQDRQPLRAHVTIQNKVSPEQARALLIDLKPEFQPFTFTAVGVDLWVYLGGPWKHLEFYAFTPPYNVST